MSENNLINTCVWCKKSFDNAMEFITHEIEMHPISSWSEEVDTEDIKMEIEIDGDAGDDEDNDDDDDESFAWKCDKA